MPLSACNWLGGACAQGVESNPSMGAALIQQAAAADPALKLKDSEASVRPAGGGGGGSAL